MTLQSPLGSIFGAPLTVALGQGVGVSPLRYPNFPKVTLARMRQVSDVFNGASTPGLTDEVDNADPYYGGATRLQYVATTTLRGILPLTTVAPVDVTGGLIRWRFGATANLLPNNSSLSVFELRLYSAGSPASIGSNYHKLNFGFGASPILLSSSAPSWRWQWHGVHSNQFTAVGTGADLTNITWARMLFQTPSGTATFSCGDIEYVPNPLSKAVVVFSWDDAVASSISIGKPLLDSYGVPGMFFPGAINSAQGIGQNGRMTAAQALAQHNANPAWQVGSQSYSTESALADYAAYLAEYNSMLAYGRSHGWGQDSYDGSWYSSVSPNNNTAYRAMKDAGVRTMHRFDNGNPTNPPWPRPQCFPFDDPSNIRRLNLAQPGGSGASITTFVQDELVATIAQKGVLYLSAHDDYTDSNVVQAATDVLTRYQSVGDFDIKTTRGLLDPFLAQYGPDPAWPAA